MGGEGESCVRRTYCSKRLDSQCSSNNPCVVYDCEEAIRQKAKIAMSVYDANKDGKVIPRQGTT